MSINNANFSISNPDLNKAVNQILGGHKEGALARFKKLGCSNESIEKITQFINKNDFTHWTTTPDALKRQILIELNDQSAMPVTANVLTEEREHPLEIMDIVDRIFIKCLTYEDVRGIQALSCTSKPISANIHVLKGERHLVDTLYLQERFPDLRILDTDVLTDLQLHEKFSISIFALVKGQQDLNPHVEGDEGTSLLIMRKGTTLNKMVDYAGSGQTEEEELQFDFIPPNISTELGEDAVEETYVVLITNSVFNNSRFKPYSEHCKLVRDEHQCELPTALEYIGLIVLTRKIYNQRLYGKGPMTCGRSSTLVQRLPLIIGGGSHPNQLAVHCFPCYGIMYNGAGGRREF